MNNLLSRNEVAKMLNVTLVTLHYWRQSGKLRGIKKGYRRLYHRRDVERIRAEQKQLELDDRIQTRSPEEMKFFDEMKSKVEDSEMMELIVSPLTEHDYHKFILDMARKYKVEIPEWFKKECRMWGVEI